MSDYKFRAYDKSIKKYIDDTHLLIDGNGIIWIKKEYPNNICTISLYPYPHNLIIERYIECDDKHNIKIYAGDIVITDEDGWKGYVSYDYQCAIFYVAGIDEYNGYGFASRCDWKEYVVTGETIHDYVNKIKTK